MSNSYKVWLRDPDGQPGTLLLRTGTPETAPDFGPRDIGDFVGTPSEVAVQALRLRERPASTVLVKDFDTGRRYTVHVSSASVVTVDGWT